MNRIVVLIGSKPRASPEGTRILPRSDQAALDLAIRGFEGPVCAWSPRGDETALRYALAAGAASADYLGESNELDFDILLAGSGGIGDGGDLVAAMLAERKGCAMVFEVLEAQLTDRGLRVIRDLGRGDREVLSIRGPAVLVISDEAARGAYVSYYRRQSVDAARLPSPKGVQQGGPETTPAWQPARPRARTVDLASRTSGAATDRMNALLGMAGGVVADNAQHDPIRADARTCSQHLLRYLAHHGFLEQKMPAALAPSGGGEVAADRPAEGMKEGEPAIELARGGRARTRGRGPRRVSSEAAKEPEETGSREAPARTRRGPVPLRSGGGSASAPSPPRGPRPVTPAGPSEAVPGQNIGTLGARQPGPSRGRRGPRPLESP